MSTTTATPVTQVTLAKFDTIEPYHTLRERQPATAYQPLTISDYRPRGGTPLRDATARFISNLKDLRSPDTVTIGVLMDESASMAGMEHSVVNGVNEFVAGMARTVPSVEAANTVLAVVFTDGFENSSREISADDLASLIRDAEADGFTFIYLGANQDAWAVGQSTGFSGSVRGQTVNYASTPVGTASALRSVTADAQQFVSSPAQYMASVQHTNSASRTISEDGTVTNKAGDVVTPEPTPSLSQGASDEVAEALKTAREATQS